MILYKAPLIFRVVPEVVQGGSDMVPVSPSHVEMRFFHRSYLHLRGWFLKWFRVVPKCFQQALKQGNNDFSYGSVTFPRVVPAVVQGGSEVVPASPDTWK